MDDKLVTVAIHTYDRAIIIKGILETEGIEVCLHNVNLIQPVISAGVRVRIKEADLPAALKILENLNFPDETAEPETPISPYVLVPVDFSAYSLKAARMAIKFAADLKAGVTLLHTYYSPIYAGGLPISDAFVFDEHNEQAMHKQIEQMHKQMEALETQLKADMAENTLPPVELTIKFREGVPEEQILTYSKKRPPRLIIMGTHGKGSKEDDLMGSVAADVVERSRVPVFAFPANMPLISLSDCENIGFVTHFDQRDLVAFESFMQLMKPYRFKVYFLHLTAEPDAWDEIKLNGIKAYFSHQYPNMESAYCMIKGDNLIDSLNEFIQERHIDLVALTAQKRSIFSRLFNPSLAKKMLFHSHTPIMVIRG
ncbi:MAG: universal stress protein [Bacteroidales bacterium]|jgi:nucleotide-binding universal stress UspA family protein|nr:universal stress protein [Bacteroidales bacterium]